MEPADPLDAIAEFSRATRRRPSKAMWIAAGVVGVVCIVAFVAMLLAEPDPTPAVQHAPVRDRGLGFAAGIAVGLAIGIGVGFAIARQRRGDHSSRNSP